MSYITKALTGHLYYRSAYESYDSCGTCTGAKCDTCREVYEFRGNVYYTYEEAISAEADYLELFSTSTPVDDDLDFVIIDDKLNYIKRVYNGKEWVDSPVLLNQEAKEAEAIRIDCLNMQERWTKCNIKDKENECLSCNIGMCRDASCYREMSQGKRTEKKWYM